MDFERFTLEEARKVVGPRPREGSYGTYEQWAASAGTEVASRAARSNLSAVSFYNGDHWQGGAGWVGPWPTPGAEREDSLRTAVQMAAEIRRGFVSRNAIKEVVDRHASGVVGRQVHWKIAPRSIPGEPDEPRAGSQEVSGRNISPNGNAPPPTLGARASTDPGASITEEDRALIREVEALMVDWWEKREIDDILRWATTYMLLDNDSFLRIFVPPDRVGDDGEVVAGDISEALDLIYLDFPSYDEEQKRYRPATATVKTYKQSMRDLGVYLYSDEKGEDRAELSYLERTEAGTANTVIKILGNDGTLDRSSLDMGGHLAHYSVGRKSFVDEPLMEQQMLLNLGCTMKQRNTVLGGFLERTLLNARLPGHYEVDENGNEVFVPDPYYIGAGVTNNIVGVTDVDDEGNEVTRQPNIVYRDPVDVGTFIRTEESAYKAILHETHQIHYLIAGDAVASGESRKQARTDYKEDLIRTGGKVQNLVQWILEAVMNLAASLAGEAGRYASLRAYAEARIDPGPMGSEDMRTWMEAAERGFVSYERVQSLFGVEDVDAENRRIELERESRESDTLRAVDRAVRDALEGSGDGDEGSGQDGSERDDSGRNDSGRNTPGPDPTAPSVQAFG